MEMRGQRRETRGDALLALAVAVILAVGGALRDWPMLSVLHLPDTDDVMRLQQIRDWIGGQRFADLAQHRIGIDGVAMHWSRLPDLAPAALIAMLTPVLGARAAELITVVAWPTLLLVAALMLVMRIARALDPASARTAAIVAALAFPASTLFLPGRIDHHGLQIVLLLLVVQTMLSSPARTGGAIAGVVAAASIVIGMETAPFLLIAAAIIWGEWLRGRDDGRMLAFGCGLAASLVAAAAIFAPLAWSYAACDGFTRPVWSAALMASAAAISLGIAGIKVTGMTRRAAASAAAGAILAIALLPTMRLCASPYAGVDPVLARIWLANVGEAQPLFGAPAVDAVGYVGVLVAGLIATTGLLAARRERQWAVLLAFQVTALALACIQLRGAYGGAMLAAPALAVMIGLARARGALWLAAAWIGSAGMLYPMAAQAIAPAPPAPAANQMARPCDTGAVVRRLAALPPGNVLGPVDLGAYLVAGTRHRAIAAPYHRNNAGNRAMYRFFTATPATARQVAASVQLDYVVICDSGFDELGTAATSDATRMIALLRRGAPPAWLRRLPAPAGAKLYAAKARLSSGPLPH